FCPHLLDLMPKYIDTISLRPSSPTLFPYTTLFRSDDRSQERADERAADHFQQDAAEEAGHSMSTFAHPGPDARTCSYCDQLPRQDRKSTRLNSSHDQRSYAVLCLKQKTLRVRKKGG